MLFHIILLAVGIWGIYAGIDLIKTRGGWFYYETLKGIASLYGGILCVFFSFIELIFEDLLSSKSILVHIAFLICGIGGGYAGIRLIKTKNRYNIISGIAALIGGILCIFLSLLGLIFKDLYNGF